MILSLNSSGKNLITSLSLQVTCESADLEDDTFPLCEPNSTIDKEVQNSVKFVQTSNGGSSPHYLLVC